MDKQHVKRQGALNASNPAASSHSLAGSASRVRQSRASKRSGPNDEDGVSISSQPTFDAVELLGPSLSEVLTFVNPPQPHRQETEEAINKSEVAASDNQSHHSSSVNSLTATKSSAKFDLRLSRSALLGKLSDPSEDNARKIQEFFVKMLSKIQCEATGLVLLHDVAIVVFLESTAEQFVAILKQFQQQRIVEAGSIKILANCNDHGVRVMQGLYFKKIVINRSDAGEWTDDAASQCIVETFLNLFKFIRKVGPMASGEIRKCLANLSNTDQTFLPSSDLVLWLLRREELMTIDEYLDFFDKPVAVQLESERVWPVHPLIHY